MWAFHAPYSLHTCNNILFFLAYHDFVMSYFSPINLISDYWLEKISYSSRLQSWTNEINKIIHHGFRDDDNLMNRTLYTDSEFKIATYNVLVSKEVNTIKLVMMECKPYDI